MSNTCKEAHPYTIVILANIQNTHTLNSLLELWPTLIGRTSKTELGFRKCLEKYLQYFHKMLTHYAIFIVRSILQPNTLRT